jgi:2-polyprenyl-6-methoxyphenol hydroxylase-like FAD-dependent oxidoreductase
LALAIGPAWRGIDVTVVERRHAGEAPEPKCNHVSARSMEVFRRLGIAAKLRNVGLPEDYPNDVSYRTSFTSVEFARIHIPCRRDRYTDKSGPDGHWPTPEPPHRVNQTFVEPVLFEHAAALPRVTILNRTQVESFEQSGAEVAAAVRNLDTGEISRISACYLVGCDGGRSMVRRGIGAQLEGDAVIQRVQATFIQASDLLRLQEGERSWMTHAVNPRRTGTIIAAGVIRERLIDDLLPRWAAVQRPRPGAKRCLA